ncbi:MAG: extracellular solute-binding protein [Proteobacteria bacterium]|nr:extracellular solute-binding protein [Pseudomonadota bacterium]
MIARRPRDRIAAWWATVAWTVALTGLSCASSGPKSELRIRFWHAFQGEEIDVLNRTLAAWRPDERISVEPVRETFARGSIMLRQILVKGENCPDLARIDATWLPGLAGDQLLTPLPDRHLSPLRWLDRAIELVRYRGVVYGIPQSIDGLALIHRTAEVAASSIPWPPRSADELFTSARSLVGAGRYRVGIRVDGYWFVPFLRQWGGSLVDVESGRLGIDTPASAAALTRFAELVKTVAPPPPPLGREAQDEARRFRAGSLPIVISGPWAVIDLTGGDTTGVAVSALPGAPLGGQVLVVPRCATSPDRAWKLAEYLTSPEVQANWARRLAVIPTTEAAVDRAGDFVKQFYRALSGARPLPRHPITPELFDALNRAVAAVVAGNATAAEALAGVARAWSRLCQQYGIEPRPHETQSAPATSPAPSDWSGPGQPRSKRQPGGGDT